MPAWAIPAAMMGSSVISGAMGKKAAKRAGKAAESRPIYAPVSMVDDKGRPYTYYRLMGMTGGQGAMAGPASQDMASVLGNAINSGVQAWGFDQLLGQREAAASKRDPVNTAFTTEL